MLPVKPSNSLKSQNGQTIVIILLVMVVVLTVGLSLTARSITDLKQASSTEQSNRAFAAAEAGIEEALRQGLGNLVGSSGSGNFTANGANYSFTVSSVGGSSYALEQVNKDTSAQLNLEGMTDGSQVKIYWGKQGETNPASLEATIVYSQGGNYQITRTAYNIDQSRGNGFTGTPTVTLNPSGLGGQYAAMVTLTLPQSPQIIRLKPWYNNAALAVEAVSPAALPAQAYKVSSEGKAGGATRKVEVIQSIPALPAIFDYVLFSTNGITK